MAMTTKNHYNCNNYHVPYNHRSILSLLLSLSDYSLYLTLSTHKRHCTCLCHQVNTTIAHTYDCLRRAAVAFRSLLVVCFCWCASAAVFCGTAVGIVPCSTGGWVVCSDKRKASKALLVVDANNRRRLGLVCIGSIWKTERFFIQRFLHKYCA
jgi:hypothetical protein